MYYPTLNTQNSTRQIIDTFGGYNHNLKIIDGEWYDETNLSAASYPLFAVRGKRGTVHSPASMQGMHAKDALLYVDGATLYYNGNAVTGLTLSADSAMQPKRMVSMGAYCVIFPDKKYVNTKDLTDYGSIDAAWEGVSGNDVSYSVCRVDGTGYELTDAYTGSTAPSDPDGGDYWIDNSQAVHVLKQYSASSEMWNTIATTYVKIAATNIGASFAAYDGVTISGCTYSGDNTALGAQISALNGDYTIYARGDGYIVVAGILDQTYTQTMASGSLVAVSRECPTMDYVCEANNRLWGCRYGSQNGQTVNEIYACKQGDFKNWRCYLGISTDSYAASVGSDGKFTGCIALSGYPLFFKENCIHKVYGAMPSQYQIQTASYRGVQEGCENSLCIVNERLYYKSRADVCVYDGSVPTGISDNLGGVSYYEASAGALGGVLYISMRTSGNVWSLFTYDTERGVWHREDATHAAGFANLRGDLVYWDATTGKIMSATGTSGDAEGDITWEAVSGIMGYEYPDAKYVSRILIRAKIAQSAHVAFAIEYDSEGGWEDCGAWYGTALAGTITIPIIPRRCDHFRIKLSGTGDTRIFSIARQLEGGSDQSWL